MKLLLIMILTVLTIGVAHAKKNCTNQPESKWMTIKDFKKNVQERGYSIRKFKQPGSCYEIYGKDKEGREVEVYFNPVDATIIKSKFE